MIAGLKSYPVMKDSGLDWLGEAGQSHQASRIFGFSDAAFSLAGLGG
jgi:hypothetical protein